MYFRFSLRFFLLTVLLFVTEVLIGSIGKHIYWLRAFGGDVLVVILLYTFVRTFLNISVNKLVPAIFLFAVCIEILQYFKFAAILGYKPGSLMYIVLGNSFSWGDIICYAIGCSIILLFTKFQR